MTKSKDIATLRPGLLVAIKTSLVGNVSYATTVIEADHKVGKERIAKWETERKVANAAEHEKAIKVRGQATHTIKRLCAVTAFGLLCPEDRAEDLTKAIAAARDIIEGFNAKARITRIRLYVIAGRVAPDDVEAVRSIRAELAATIGEMEAGVRALSPESVRDAARRAAQLAEMLNDQAKAKVGKAIEAARATATAINKAVKAGEQAALKVDEIVAKRIAKTREVFVDADNTEIAQPAVAARTLDLAEEA